MAQQTQPGFSNAVAPDLGFPSSGEMAAQQGALPTQRQQMPGENKPPKPTAAPLDPTLQPAIGTQTQGAQFRTQPSTLSPSTSSYLRAHAMQTNANANQANVHGRLSQVEQTVQALSRAPQVQPQPAAAGPQPTAVPQKPHVSIVGAQAPQPGAGDAQQQPTAPIGANPYGSAPDVQAGFLGNDASHPMFQKSSADTAAPGGDAAKPVNFGAGQSAPTSGVGSVMGTDGQMHAPGGATPGTTGAFATTGGALSPTPPPVDPYATINANAQTFAPGGSVDVAQQEAIKQQNAQNQAGISAKLAEGGYGFGSTGNAQMANSQYQAIQNRTQQVGDLANQQHAAIDTSIQQTLAQRGFDQQTIEKVLGMYKAAGYAPDKAALDKLLSTAGGGTGVAGQVASAVSAPTDAAYNSKVSSIMTALPSGTFAYQHEDAALSTLDGMSVDELKKLSSDAKTMQYLHDAFNGEHFTKFKQIMAKAGIFIT